MFLACQDVDNCLHNGKEVLLNYGFDINRFNVDLIILGAFYIISYALGYYGLYKKIKKQPDYWMENIEINHFFFTIYSMGFIFES